MFVVLFAKSWVVIKINTRNNKPNVAKLIFSSLLIRSFWCCSSHQVQAPGSSAQPEDHRWPACRLLFVTRCWSALRCGPWQLCCLLPGSASSDWPVAGAAQQAAQVGGSDSKFYSLLNWWGINDETTSVGLWSSIALRLVSCGFDPRTGSSMLGTQCVTHQITYWFPPLSLRRYDWWNFPKVAKFIWHNLGCDINWHYSLVSVLTFILTFTRITRCHSSSFF